MSGLFGVALSILALNVRLGMNGLLGCRYWIVTQLFSTSGLAGEEVNGEERKASI